MKNPIQVFEKIRDNFILYVETAFGTQNISFKDERKELLLRDKTFARAPWVEPLPKYISSGLRIDDIDSIPNLSSEELEIFKKIVNAGLVEGYEIYEHQLEMLNMALEGKHCVITSGTGSGKTEAFLLPLFAALSKEMNKWQKSENIVNNTKWWGPKWGPAKIVGKGNTTLKEEARQRPEIRRHPAIRAMLLYPMNALVEDQLARLRKALDSDDARKLFTDDYNNNRIYFGRYNSTSPSSGKLFKINEDDEIVPNDFKVAQLRKELGIIEENNLELSNYIKTNPKNLDNDKLKDLVANFQRLDGAEMRTRFDMQVTPPDILISNFSMLSIMLMRDIENPIFNKTKAWLDCETEFDKSLTEEEIIQEKKERIFHIVIDELHLYRGGSGSEIAYLIRMLLDRIGLSPDSDQLRILASSASLEGEEGEIFLKSFFGTEKKKIHIIKGIEDKPSGEVDFLLPVDVFKVIGDKALDIDEELETLDSKDKLDTFLDNLLSSNGVDWHSPLIDYILNNQENIGARLYSAFNIQGRTRAVPAFKNGKYDDTKGVKSISEVLFGKDEIENMASVKGFFYTLGLLERYEIKHQFPSMRFHLFYRNIPGLWGELIPDSELEERERVVGKILPTPELTHKGRRSLELLYCENCGTLAYGGSRVKYINESLGNETELIPLSPDIEGVPENSPATIVEKRKYFDFGVFCPGHFANIELDKWIHPSAGKEGRWVTAWLNIYSGKLITEDPDNIIDFVKGKWFRIIDGDDIANFPDNQTAMRASALPAVCPHCEADYSHPMKKKQSPFRGFRTGFGKVSQILSKELFSALPVGDETRKLVAFSDSREEAAKLAKNIEEEHYNSLLKEVIIHNITDILQLEYNIIHALDNGNEELKNRYKELDPVKYNAIGQVWQNVNGEFSSQENIETLQNIKDNIKPINALIDVIIHSFLSFGINPGGPMKSIETIRIDYKENGKDRQKYIPWFNFFDFTKSKYDKTVEYWEIARLKINDSITKKLANHIFGRLFYSFEASGLGYATVSNNDYLIDKANNLDLQPDSLLQICNSFMRIWGDNFKHSMSDFEVTKYDEFENLPKDRKERKYIRKVASKLPTVGESDLGNAVYSILERNHHRGVIEINNLQVKIANNNTLVFKCSKCGTIHLHKSAGICVFCRNELDETSSNIAGDLWKKSYLTASLTENYNPFRLHTEELTGQTDDQLARQRKFRNIFLSEDVKKTQQIDLLSVTTTLEVGVDIGALQAIFLANMPPQRFNYQQRVGRTGRRGQLFSYALTFARGRSHDEFYFENPFSITGDKPPQPFLSLNQRRIFERVLAKAILHYAFKVMGEQEGSVHGEFGGIESFNSDTLSRIIHESFENEVQSIFNALNTGVYNDGEIEPFEFDEFREWIFTLPDLIQTKIDEQQMSSGDLSNFLAETGILPMAGMPTRIRNLIHGFNKIDKDKYEAQNIDRDLSMAIYEFAPGSQKTKDKGVIQSIGFTPNIEGIEKNYANGATMEPMCINKDAFTERKWLVQNIDTKEITSHPYMEDQDEKGKPEISQDEIAFVGATPAAFRTNFKYPKDANEEFDINFSKPLTFAESAKEKEVFPAGNFQVKYSQQELTWKINDNGGDQFKGSYIKHKKYGADFENQWITNDFYGEIYDIRERGEEETLSLATSKVTEVFRIEPQQIPLSIEINPFSKDLFKASSSKGAYYSAAFLLQRTLADTLDIDPEEIEIAAIEKYKLPEIDGVEDRTAASIVLADELPNGSGFISQLYKSFAKYNGDELIDGYLKKCIDPAEEDRYNYNILNGEHALTCQDSCYGDLRNFRNMNFHALLDWRLGVGLLRLFADKNYSSGLKEEDYRFPELLNWRDFSKQLCLDIEKSFTNIKYSKWGELSGFTIADSFKVIVVHPFWNYSHHQPQESILTEAIAIAGLENTFFIDTFNLHRRQGWCYGELIQKIQDNG